MVKPLFFRTGTQKKEVFRIKKKMTRKEAREHLANFHFGAELVKAIRHFFPNLMALLRGITEPRHQSYITYQGHVLLATRILSAIFYISSMRKTSEAFNSEIVIENIGCFCGETLEELPYWETVNNYLKRVNPEELQNTVCALAKRLVRSGTFDGAKIRGKYWQILIDGTGIVSSREELDGPYTFKVHNKGTDKEYTEYFYYALEAKLVLGNDIVVSVMTEFVENKEGEWEKQDCERKACKRLMKRLKETFPNLPICISGDSLYACNPFFEDCEAYHWHYIVRFKEGSLPTVFQAYEALRKTKGHSGKGKNGQISYRYDFVNDIDYQGHKLNCLEYREDEKPYPFVFLTDLPLSRKNAPETAFFGRRRWKIENQGFNAQKNHGFSLSHLFSRNCRAMKNHYYLIQIGHMIAQIMDAWKSLWRGIRQSREQKHSRMLESWKTERLSECDLEAPSHFQILLE